MAQPVEPAVNLEALEELNSPEARALFDMVDKLSALGVGKIVDLPQIIVVGDQSAGKSSVLGAISQVHFPVHGGVCTRFATELVLSPGSRRRVRASVHFADSSKAAYTLHVEDFDQKDIAEIIGTAKKQMGLSETSREYSRDVLRLEIEGPNMHHLTLVDLPGIYHNDTDQQSPEGIRVVRDIVRTYMKKPNSIILAIISASSGFANQAVMKLAAKHDAARERTLGVVTKPDLPAESSDLQKEYLQLVRNAQTTHKLKLGWHVVRNRADDNDARPQDAIEEEFFRTGAWSSIPASDRGIITLRKRLSKLLHEHIKKSLPTVIKDVQHQLSERGDEHSRLGLPRSTPGAMRLYLSGVAERFRDLVVDGTRGHYTDPFFGGFDEDDRKLRAQLRMWNRAIRHILMAHGSTYDLEVEQFGMSTGSGKQRKLPPYLEEFLRRRVYPELPTPKVISRLHLATQLERQAAINQGNELPGYSNMGLATQLFQEQTKQWEPLAAQHLEKVIATIRDFVEQVVHDVTGQTNERTNTAVLSTLVDPFFDERQEVLSAKLREILRPVKESYTLALDADFQEAMCDLAARRRFEEVRKAQDDPKEPSPLRVELADGEFGTERIVDTVQTFCEMSLRTFTDNLINLVIESCLVRELPNIFSPSVVAAMSDEELSTFASEEDGVTNRRSELQTDIALLKQGLELCRRNMPRNVKDRTTNATDAVQNKPAADLSGVDALPSTGPPHSKEADNHDSTTSSIFPVMQASPSIRALFEQATTPRSTKLSASAAPAVPAVPAVQGATFPTPAFSRSSGSNSQKLKPTSSNPSGSGLLLARTAPVSEQVLGNANPGSGSGGLFGSASAPAAGSGAKGNASGKASSMFAGGLGAIQPAQSGYSGIFANLGTPAK